MGVKFKCKKCKKRFNTAMGRSEIIVQVADCENILCPLKHKSLSHVPEKRLSLPMVIPKAANDIEIPIETYEDIPIGGLISFREVKKRNGF